MLLRQSGRTPLQILTRPHNHAGRAGSSAIRLASSSTAVNMTATPTKEARRNTRYTCARMTVNPFALRGTKRQFASAATRKFTQAAISEEEYHRLADACMNALTDSLEALVDEYDGPGADEFEAEYASGVLNVRLGTHGTYVINKQPPNKQIWFSSPRSGPKRFDYDAEHAAWFMLKDGKESNLRDLLDAELSDVFGTKVNVDLGEGDR